MSQVVDYHSDSEDSKLLSQSSMLHRGYEAPAQMNQLVYISKLEVAFDKDGILVKLDNRWASSVNYILFLQRCLPQLDTPVFSL